MSLRHFFPFFHEAWIKAVKSPDNVKAGFRKSGIVPFHPEAVDYSKRIRSVSDQKSQTSQNTTLDEKVGFARCFQMFEAKLLQTVNEQFQRRWENKYDINQTDRGMWQFYKDARIHIESVQTDATTQIDTLPENAPTENEMTNDNNAKFDTTSHFADGLANHQSIMCHEKELLLQDYTVSFVNTSLLAQLIILPQMMNHNQGLALLMLI